ncbi:MAG: NAD(P)H-hydrate dehydratase [Candidatus Thermoplasmatota archaeon]|nr:NAD(P)H-hydrate dehydratase [Candidatus Thermoplasmatota archaeon]
MTEPACWELEWDEVAVLDRNASAMGIEASLLMRAAGEALAKRAIEMSGGAPILFLCGPGNNGGDGFVAAAIVRQSGGDASVLASHSSSRGDTASEARVTASDLGVRINVWPMHPEVEARGLLVDCLLGAGATGPGASLRPPINEIVGWARDLGRPVLACDIPTGLGGADSLSAVETITFHSLKRGLSPEECGKITVVPLPWPREVEDCGIGDIERYPRILDHARKGDRGRLWVIGGGPYHGAPILAGMAAARSGCDLVHVAMPSAAVERAEWPATLIPEALPDREMLTVASIGTISHALESLKAPQAVVIGPGLGRHESTLEAVTSLLGKAAANGIPVVIDADGLAALPEGFWPVGLHGVATPHASEAKRWLGDESPESALSGASGEDAVIVITGPEDELTGPRGRRCFATGGHPRMAVGGTGDLLAGTIGGLLAQGMGAWPAARLGCALLREAGSRAAASTGPGLLAEDVPIHIAQALATWLGDERC